MTADSLLTGSRDGQRLRIDFHRTIDRYQQALWLVAGGREVCVLTTVEGTGQQEWPPSPPLQHLHQHQTPTGDLAALGVGMAGTSHWSLAVEASADQPAFCCDVACRVKKDLGHLAVSWKSASNIKVNTMAERSVELIAEIGSVRIYVTEEDEFAAELSVGREVEHGSHHICLSPHATTGAPPKTLRWRYRIELA